ncbi:MAG: thioesterase family protein [Candidatus Ancillula sp.]|jgi:acyl-CoA thioesterase-2|nr:thioesterase family protein [Candidatus Ancillula sp.]
MPSLAQVLKVLDLEQNGADKFTGGNISIPTGAVYGGQFLAQSIIAASRTTSEYRFPNSMHAYFIKSGDLKKEICYTVDRLRDGVKFSHRELSASQKVDNREVLAFRSLLNFHEKEDSALDFSAEIPDVPLPEEVQKLSDRFLERGVKGEWGNYFINEAPFEVRQISPSLFLTQDDTPDRIEAAWFRINPEDVEMFKKMTAEQFGNNSETLNRALLAFISDQFAFSPAIRKSNLNWMTHGASYVSLDHSQHFHRAVDLSKWHLIYGTSPAGANARGIGVSNIFSIAGDCVSTVVQEGSIRVADHDSSVKF